LIIYIDYITIGLTFVVDFKDNYICFLCCFDLIFVWCGFCIC
jgi:hypothetical protein